MRLVQGMDLGRILATQGAVPPGRAIAIVAQVASALDAAHGDGLVYRDVKPENVLVTPADFAYLVDFGIAHSGDASRLTETGSTIGSFAYMAPERFNDVPPAPSADIYSLTCVLYECLTGSKPFPQRSVTGLVAAHSASPPPRLPDGLSAFDDVIGRGMAKDPAQRFRTCAELVDAANHALTRVGQATAPTVVATPPPQDSRQFAPTVVRAQPRRSRRGIWLAACAAIVIAVAGVAGYVAFDPGSEESTQAASAARATEAPEPVDTPTSVAAQPEVATDQPVAIPGESCGRVVYPQTGTVADIYVDTGAFSCPEALNVFNRYLHDSTVTHTGGNTWPAQFDGWTCNTPTAATADANGYVGQCTSATVVVSARRPAVAAQPTPAPVVTTQPIQAGVGDLGLAIPMTIPECDGTGIVVLGNAVEPGDYAAEISALLAQHPGASYLRTDQACPSLRQRSDAGNPIYAVYRVAGYTRADVCAAVAAAGGGSYGKWLDTSTDPTIMVAC
ncbi:MAG TPA: serine/threonine-protein kinase [Aldersonia sp.]